MPGYLPEVPKDPFDDGRPIKYNPATRVLYTVGPDRAFPDSGGASRKDLVLTDEWKRYRIDLEGVDLSCIKTGFGFSFGGQGSVKTFFLDDIEYVP